MTDEDMQGGGGDGAERLSNSQLEAQAGAYDPALHGGPDGISEQDWNQLPGWRKGAMHRMAVRRNEAAERAARAEGAVEQMRRELAEVKAQVQNGNKPAEAEPEGWASIKTPKLEEYVSKAERTLHAAMLDPSNEALKEQASRIDPDLLSTARRELAKRDAGGAIAEKEKTWNDSKAREQAQTALLMRLRTDFGNDGINPKSALLRAAAEEIKSMDEERALFGEAATTYMAVERAHKRLNGTQRAMRDDERARLMIEGGVRREASPFNEIEALRQKGDWKSRGLATEKSLDMALAQLFPS